VPYKNKEDQKKWYKDNPESRKNHQRKYRKAHKLQIALYSKSHTKRHNELERLSNIKRQEKGPLVVRAYNCARNANKRARDLKVRGRITETEVMSLFKQYKNVCIGCYNELPGLDHVIPLSKGGLNVITNCQPLGLNCNITKNIGCTDFRKRTVYVNTLSGR
jgi:hypothetical protein